MGALIWQSEHKNEAHGCAVDMDGHAGPSVFDIQKVGEVVTVYDYVNSQPFRTDEFKTVDQAKAACDLRYKEWLERMGLVSVAVQDVETVARHIRGFWRTPLQIHDSMGEAGIPTPRLNRAIATLLAEGRIEQNPKPTGAGSPTYRWKMA
ncbi:hypothetical protein PAPPERLAPAPP_02560 [Brevundimonas phage vB_BpoS-Papperlapapp]|uniref:Uncharacterized protein n=1 Tax=Brevundimonas phage vB_BpoS-Kabachok TaxID=2948600 RepID=A0A9E7SJX9_9CAUD|nr:hypothetical protein KABACHOK_00930 [Brevundimonas phage vB_BpoS-Kabachok]USN15997.1 hypothetical protein PAPPERLAPAPP_02560 [Brevundimonas phage vB_BpoS-Papperlapapp]